MAQSNKENISIRPTADDFGLKEKLKKLAKKQNRSLNNYIIQLLKKAK